MERLSVQKHFKRIFLQEWLFFPLEFVEIGPFIVMYAGFALILIFKEITCVDPIQAMMNAASVLRWV